MYPVFKDIPEVTQLIQRCDELRGKNNISDYLTSMVEKQKLLFFQSSIDFIDFNIDLQVIKEIILDPRAESYFTEMFFSYMRNRNLNVKYFKSGLYNRTN